MVTDVDGNELSLVLWDPVDHPSETFTRQKDTLRALVYPECAVIVVCFDISNIDSFYNVKRCWIPELLHFCPMVPFLLVGCKADLRPSGEPQELNSDDGKRRERVSKERGHTLAVDIGAVGYLECSAKAGVGVKEVQLAAGRVALAWDPYPQRSHTNGCYIV